MKERPIIFSTQMVRAILRGAKTQTRRVIPVLPKRGYSLHQISEDKFCFRKVHKNGDATHSDIFRRPFDPCDLLWVRETYRPIVGQLGALISVDYRADPPEEWERLGDVVGTHVKWRPAIHMPREMSRLVLKVTDIRAEPLRDISDTDAMREGLYPSFLRGTPMPIAMDWDGNKKVLVAGVPKRDFEALWRGLYPEGKKSWGANPWVWVIDFDIVKRP